MIEQVSTSVRFHAFFSASGEGLAGLVDVVVSIWKPDGTLVVNAQAATELAGGWYFYDLPANDADLVGEYPGKFVTADTTVDAKEIPVGWVIGRAGVENIDAAIGSRLATSGYTAPLSSAGTRAAVGLAAADLDTQLAAIAAFIDTEIAAIKAVTDLLPDGGALSDLATLEARLTAARAAKIDLLTSARLKRATAVRLTFPMKGTDGSLLAGLVVAAGRSLDGATTFVSCANTVVEIDDGSYYIDLEPADIDGDVYVFRFTAAGAAPTLIYGVTGS